MTNKIYWKFNSRDQAKKLISVLYRSELNLKFCVRKEGRTTTMAKYFGGRKLPAIDKEDMCKWIDNCEHFWGSNTFIVIYT